MLGFPFWSQWMPTYDRDFQLGLLPERKWNWRTFAASYGLVAASSCCWLRRVLVPESSCSRRTSRDRTGSAARLETRAGAEAEAAAGARKVVAAESRCSRRRSCSCRKNPRTKAEAEGNEPPKVALNNFAPAVLNRLAERAPVADSHRRVPGKFGAPTVNAADRESADRRLWRSQWIEAQCKSKPNGTSDRLRRRVVRHACRPRPGEWLRRSERYQGNGG